MIKIVNISKSFDDHQVLNQISISFESGIINLVIGESGSGKTVLMKCLVGLHQIDSGHIFYDERNYSKMSQEQMKEIRKEIGMLFQGGALFDSMTVLDNVIFPLKMLTNMTYRQRTKRAKECLDEVNLKGADKLFPAEISGGMKKRVAIARAIAINPKYLFCDEPNSGLDPKTASIIDKLIADITKEYGMTTIINTHDMNSVMGIGEKVSFIHKGKLWWEGDSKSLLKSDNPEIKEFLSSNEVIKQFSIS